MVRLECQLASDSPAECGEARLPGPLLSGPRLCDSAGLERGLRILISDAFPGAAGLGTTL